MKKLICQGAEAILYKKGQGIVKDRVKKTYRFEALDERLRRQRSRKEAKLLEKAFEIINVPKLIKLDEKNKIIEMEFIKGKKLSESLDELGNAIEICKKIGNSIGKLHDAGIIHGDLTTSNMIWKNEEVYFIDFGLGFESSSAEDKAVDLHLIKQALEAKHFGHFDKYFQAVLEGYKNSKHKSEVVKRLEKVEKRGRYKQAY